MKNTALIFLPLLLLYVILVLLLSNPTFQGDEGGYVEMAGRLAHGYYAPKPGGGLWWGPGYPLVLAPFAYLKLPWLAAKILNAFFLFGAILYLHKTLSLWVADRYARIVAFLMGVYPPFWRAAHLLLTESLVFFLVCGLMFYFCRAHTRSRHQRLHVLTAAFFMTYLALTKILFGYVILAGLCSSVLLSGWRKKAHLKTTVAVYGFALIGCLPYLAYTYSVTGNVFYWGTSGGLSLYWMSTPYENEWGSWFHEYNDVRRDPRLAPHLEFFDKIAGLSAVERDRELKKQAISNIRNHPTKYLVNWAANIGRMLFSYPYSYQQDRLSTYFYLLPNIFIVVPFALGIYPALSRWRSIPYAIRALLFFAAIAFGGTSLLSAFERQFRPLVPILLLWLSFVYLRVLRIEIRPDPEIRAHDTSC